MKKIMHHVVQKRTIFILCILSFCAAIGLGIYYGVASLLIIPRTEKRLLSMVRKQIESINDYLQKKEEQLNQLVDNNQIHEALIQAAPLFKSDPFRTLIKPYIEADNFENVILIDVKGTVIFSSKEGEKFAINLKESPYNITNLGRFWHQTMLTLTTSVSSLAYDLILKKPTLYIIRPVFASKKLVGFIAAQINQEHIYKITHNYFELGNTGEVVLGEFIENGVQIIAPTRNDPESEFNVIEYTQDNPTIALQRAVLGQEGTDVGLDHRGIQTINAWGYIPILAWGLVAKIDEHEIMTSLKTILYIMYIFFLIALVLLIMSFVLFKKTIESWIQSTEAIRMLSSILHVNTLVAGAFLISFIVIVFLIFQYFHLRYQAIENAHMMATTKINSATQVIIGELEKVMLRAQAVADDLDTGRLKKEDLLIRMERDLRENPSLFGLTIAYAPYAYDSTKKLYAPHMVKEEKSLQTLYIESLYDYTSKDVDIAQWYHKSLAEGPMWFTPGKDNLSHAVVAYYAVPFYGTVDKSKKAPIGVVVAEYNINNLTTVAQKMVIGETGYFFVIVKDGTLIYHPNTQLVEDKKTIFNVAQEQKNKELYAIGQHIIQTPFGQVRYTDSISNDTMWIHFNSVPITQWSLGIVFAEKEIIPSSDTIRHMLIWILISCVVALILLSYLLCNVLCDQSVVLRNFAIAISIVFFVALVCLFIIIQQTSGQVKGAKEVVITSETSLKAYLNEQQRKAATHYKTLTFVPTGIFLNSLTFPSTEHVSFTGYIWQKYNTKDKDIIREIRFPEATQFSLEKEFHKIEGDIEIIGWKATVTLRQFYNYRQYPFDQHKIVIPILPKAVDSRVTLIPSLSDPHMHSGQFIGISPELSLSAFNIKKTYFSFATVPQESALDIKAQEKIKPQTNLQFNVIIARGILNAFVVYIVPILVVLFFLFAIFLKLSEMKLTQMAVTTSIALYTGLLCALIVLHGYLRSNYRVGGFLYIEYLFFLTYITILLFIIHVLLLSKNTRAYAFAEKLTLILKLFFWPVQCACWFIATVIVFYN